MECEGALTRRPKSQLHVAGLCLSIFFAQHVGVVYSQGTILPTIECQSPITVPEDTKIGSTLFSLSAKANSGGSYPAVNVTLTIANVATRDLVNLTEAAYSPATDHWTSDVILAVLLDRDFEPSTRQLSFHAMDTGGNANNRYCQIIIEDVNDNPPTFLDPPYSVSLFENATVGTTVLDFTVTDYDSGYGGRVMLYPQFPDSAVEVTFNTTVAFVGSETMLEVILAQTLDYETRSFYDFTVLAKDGLNLTSTETVEVRVIDIQDTPPFFLQFSYRAAIPENEPVGTYVIKVSAVDGDRDPPNDIVYSIVNGSVTLFNINSTTGEITSNAVFDRDTPAMLDSGATFHLTVRATEITSDGTPQSGDATSEVAVLVTVEDVNDEGPTFSSDRAYTASVREDAPLNSLIYFSGDGYVSVSDADVGTNSHFTMTVERDGLPWTQLAATPSEIYSEAFVLLRVMDPEVFKDSTGQHINLQLVAREVSTSERRSSTAEVVITVEAAPQPPSTSAPIIDNSTTPSDVVVFIIGFLVVFNVAATVFIVWFILRRRKEPRQGLVRKGSKYYVNGGTENLGFQKGDGAGSGSPLRPESVLVEVDGKDRCDVVPLSAVLTSEQRSQYGVPVGVTAHRKLGSGGGLTLSDDTAMDSSDHTERKVLVANEVSPATSNKSAPVPANTTAAGPGTSAEEKPTLPAATTSTKMTAAASPPPPPPSARPTTSPTSPPLPDFTMAKRNVSSPHSPSVSFVHPAGKTSSSASASSPPVQPATTAFPSASTTNDKQEPIYASVMKTTESTTTIATAAHTATHTTTTATSTAATATPVEPVTRFSAKGVVSTTVAAIPGYAVATSVGLPGGTTVSVENAGSGSDATRAVARAPSQPATSEPAMTEVLY